MILSMCVLAGFAGLAAAKDEWIAAAIIFACWTAMFIYGGLTK